MKKRDYFWVSLIVALIILGSVYYLGKSDGKQHKAEPIVVVK
ncbi:hypothetical protein GGE08_003134 [Muricauda sp. ARW1Y1]|jgi:hypothetical protein|nr:hypothetical protein [Muricauda sp. ARW1Y1]